MVVLSPVRVGTGIYEIGALARVRRCLLPRDWSLEPARWLETMVRTTNAPVG